MELFTEVEFNENELGRIDEVRYRLAEEGWDEYHKDEHTVIRAGKGRIVKSIKYKWRRII
jgi:hypothetical protein